MIAFGFTFNACWEGPKTMAKAYLFVTLEEASDELIAAWTAKYGGKWAALTLPKAREALAFVKGSLPMVKVRRKDKWNKVHTFKVCQSHAVVTLKNVAHEHVGRYEFNAVKL
jgi:hypothetical protein